MTKKAQILFYTLALLVVLTLVYFFFFSSSKILSNGYKAVPLNTPILLEVKNYTDWHKKLSQKTAYWSELIQEKDFEKIERQLQQTDSLIYSIDELKKLLKQKPLLISLNIVGRETIQPTYILETDELTSESSIHSLIAEYFKDKATIKQKEYQETDIYTLHFTNKPPFSYAFYKGIWIFSPSSMQIESSIRQIDGEESILDNPAFSRVHKTAGKHVDANLYIQYKTFYKLFKQFIKKNHHASFKNIMYWADWTELDIDFEKDLIFLNGFTFSNPESNNYLNVFKGQSPDDINIFEISPLSTSAILAFHLSDYEEFQENLLSYHKRRNKGQGYQKWFQDFKAEYQFDIQEAIKDIIENEIALIYTNTNPLNLVQKTYLAIETNGERRTMDALMPLLENWSEKRNIEVSALITEHQVKDQKTVNIYRFPKSKLSEKWLGNAFAHAKTNYFTFINDYMIFGDTQADLISIIDDNERKSTLENTPSFIKLTESFSSESNLFFYQHTSSSKALHQHILSEMLFSKVTQNFNTLKKFQSLVFQINNSDDLFYTNGILTFNSKSEDMPHTIWESKLDTMVSIKPKVVFNHRNNKKEIFVQDLKHNIYLIDRNGKVLWRQNIGDKIVSEVYQVDYYKNKKLQYLFNTQDKIYLIDRNGNPVAKYPIRLRANATAGLSVFDYDQSRDYRLCIPCEDRQIYMYNIEGKVLPGWTFQGTESIVNTPIQHFRIGITDYILCSDNHRVYILNRRGEEKVDLNIPVNKSPNNIFYLTYQNEIPYFSSTMKDGNILMINEKGEVAVKKGLPVNGNHHAILVNLDPNPLFDVVYTDGTDLKILYNLKEQFNYDFSGSIRQPIPFEFSSNDIKIGTCDIDNQNLYLFNSNGKMYKGFPLKGSSLFSISLFDNGSGRFNLIAGSKDGFLYNYEVP